MVTDNRSTSRPDLLNDLARESAARPGVVTLSFGLSLATGLPPAALLVPSGVLRPATLADVEVVLGPSTLGAVLGRPMDRMLFGRIALGLVDRRLRGLESILQVFQATDGTGALVCTSVVGTDPAAGDGITPDDLLGLVCEAMLRHGVTHERRIDVGPDAFLAIYGEMTAQLVWMAGGRLLTVNATCPFGDRAWTIDAARSIAGLLDRPPPRLPLGA